MDGTDILPLETIIAQYETSQTHRNAHRIPQRKDNDNLQDILNYHTDLIYEDIMLTLEQYINDTFPLHYEPGLENTCHLTYSPNRNYGVLHEDFYYYVMTNLTTRFPHTFDILDIELNPKTLCTAMDPMTHQPYQFYTRICNKFVYTMSVKYKLTGIKINKSC